MRTTLFLADDRLIFYRALSLWLEQVPDFAIVGAVAEAGALVEQLDMAQTDILLLNWELADVHTVEDKVRLIRTLQTRFPRLRILVLSSTPGIRRQVLATGVHAFISKSEPPEHLLAALQRNRAVE